MPAPRPNLRPTQGLHNLGKGGNPDAKYVTNCKLCPAGVYKHEPHRWPQTPGAPLGISHDECLTRAGLL